MNIRFENAAWKDVAADWLVVPVTEGAELADWLHGLDEAAGGLVRRLQERGDLTGKAGDLCPVLSTTGVAADRLLFVGTGPAGEIDLARLERSVRAALRHVTTKPDRRVAVAWPTARDIAPADVVRSLAIAAEVAGVGQAVYQSERPRHPLKELVILHEGSDELKRAANVGMVLGESINLTRDLVNRCADEIFPAAVADRARAVAEKFGLNCEVLKPDRIESERMGALLAVAKGSDKPPRVVVLGHLGGGTGAPTLALVGKGVCFDSGGLSIKPSEGMNTMKGDMAGAATVLGAMAAIARLKLPVNVVGYLGLVENMISGSSYKLGDVLTARNGVTIEVLNTDAEGRLVLADVLHYAAERGADRIVDLATLTGACVVALGEDVTGAFTNNAQWCDALLSAARRCGERVWQLPMYAEYAELLKSDVADCKNVGPRWGGAITAAKFLEKFVEGKPWVHLDIAGPSFAGSNQPDHEGGGTGVMVRTLVELAESMG
jgi:leucyl aminopeptidase